MKKLLFISLLILTIALAGCAAKNKDIQTNNYTSEEQGIESLSKIKTSEEIEKESENFKAEANEVDSIVESGNQSQCQKITDENLKTECLNTIIIRRATEQNNPKICNDISEESWKDSCLHSLGF